MVASKTKQHLLRGLSFLVLAVLLLSGLSWLLRDRQTTLSCLYSEEDNSLDLLLVGSSHVNSGYIPSLLWQENGISACNVYSWSQPMWVSYHHIKEALKTQQPKMIVLELFGMTYGHSSIMPEEIDRTSYQNSFNIDPSLNWLQMIRTAETCGLDLRPYEDFLNLPRYHTRWKQPSLSMLTYNPHKDPDPLKGYGFLLTAVPQQKPEIAPQPALTPYEYCVEYLEKIVALCEKEGIRLVFTITPYVYNEAEQGIFQWISEYAQNHNIPLLNYNGPDGERIGIDYATDLSDWGHLNYSGAQKVTMDLCRFLQDYAQEFPAREEHRNAALLDEQLGYYQRIAQVQPLLSETDYSAWLARAAADPELVVFLQADGTDGEALRLTNRALAAAGHKPIAAGGRMRIDENGAQACGEQLDFALFDKKGRVEFNPAENAILLNGKAAPLGGEAVTAVVYDTVLGRPLESASLSESLEFTHREFTSDLLPQYR